MKKLAIGVLAAVLFISACKKDDDKKTESNSFVINGNTVATPYGISFDYGEGEKQIVFADAPVSDTFVGKVSAVSIDIDTLIDGASYTLLSKEATGFDRTKNFYDAFTLYQVTLLADGGMDTTGTWLEAPTAGTVTVKKSGENYTIGYSIQFSSTTVTGKYSGKLTAGN
jgi:hypothetical protein